MTIDEAIKYCLKVVEINEQAKKDGNLWIDTEYEDCVAEHRQLAEWLTELKEAKRLLKAAVEDIVWLNEHIGDGEGRCLIETATDIETCLACPLNVNHPHICGWKHQAEALVLIREGGDTP